MADERKISELTQVTTLNDDDELVFVKYVVQPFPLEFRWFDLSTSQTHTNPTKTGWVLQAKNFHAPTNGQSWDSSKWTTLYTSSQLSQTPGGQSLGEITHPSIPALAVDGTYSGALSRTLDGMEISLVYDEALGYYKVYIQSALYRMGSGEQPLTAQQYNQHWADINGEYSITEPTQLFIKDFLWEDAVSALASLPAIANTGGGNPGPAPSPSFESLTTEYANLTPEQKKDEASGTDYIIGTIVYNDLEGGFYGIELPSIDGGAKFLPLNIQDELVGHEGKEIKIKLAYSKLDDDGMVSIFMWGKLIFVDEYHIHEWSIGQVCNNIEVTGLTSSNTHFNGTYDYYPHSTITGRPLWVKNGVYNSDGTLDFDATIVAGLPQGAGVGFIYWIESTTGDSWWQIWSNLNGSAEYNQSTVAHCPEFCQSTGTNNTMKLPYHDDGPGGFGSGVTLTPSNC